MSDPAAPSLRQALWALTAPAPPEAQADQITSFCAALTHVRGLQLWHLRPDAPPELLSGAAEPSTAPGLVQTLPQAEDGHAIGPDALALRLSLAEGQIGGLYAPLAGLPDLTRSLAFERLVFVQTMLDVHHAPRQNAPLRQALEAASGFDRADPEALQRLADSLADATSAGYAAAAWMEDTDVTQLAISGQAQQPKRAALPQALRAQFRAARVQASEAPDTGHSPTAFALDPVSGRGVALMVDAPQTLPELPGILAQILRDRVAQRHGRRRRALPVRLLGLGLIVIGALCVPIPDGVRLPATLEANAHRKITSPRTALLREVLVAEDEAVRAGQVLARLDTNDLDLDLIAARAEHAEALLRRETARAARRAADLRLAEVAADRLAARIALLEERRAMAEIRSPIDGAVFDSQLASRQGSVLRQGDVLLQVAAPGALHLALQVPQQQIGRVSLGAEGVFRPDFDPSLRLGARIDALSHAALETERLPKFLGTAQFEAGADGAASSGTQSAATGAPTDSLRHGMSGVLVLRQSWTPAGIVIWTKLRDWAMLRFWF